MITPAILLGFLISSALGAAFHILRGGGLGRLILYLLFSWIGFAGGQFLAQQMSLSFGNVGQINLLFASMGSILFMLFGSWLVKPNS